MVRHILAQRGDRKTENYPIFMWLTGVGADAGVFVLTSFIHSAQRLTGPHNPAGRQQHIDHPWLEVVMRGESWP